MSDFITVVLMVGVCVLAVLSCYKLYCAIRDRRDSKKAKKDELSDVGENVTDNGKGEAE